MLRVYPRLSHRRYMSTSAASLILAIVDDDTDIRRAVGRSLRSYGHKVHLYESGEAYLAENCKADCAIVDINLPGVSGLEMEEQLRRSGRGIPVVFITAHDDLAHRAVRTTGMPVLTKPLDEHDLLDAIALVTGNVIES